MEADSGEHTQPATIRRLNRARSPPGHGFVDATEQLEQSRSPVSADVPDCPSLPGPISPVYTLSTSRPAFSQGQALPDGEEAQPLSRNHGHGPGQLEISESRTTKTNWSTPSTARAKPADSGERQPMKSARSQRNP